MKKTVKVKLFQENAKFNKFTDIAISLNGRMSMEVRN